LVLKQHEPLLVLFSCTIWDTLQPRFTSLYCRCRDGRSRTACDDEYVYAGFLCRGCYIPVGGVIHCSGLEVDQPGLCYTMCLLHNILVVGIVGVVVVVPKSE